MKTTREIESELVDAIEVESTNYQTLDRTWPAVHAAIDGLRERDAEIGRLRAALAEATERSP